MGLLPWLVGNNLGRATISKLNTYNSGLAILITASIFLGSGIAGLENRKSPVDLKSLVKMGFGAVEPKAFVGFFTPSVCTP